MCISKPKAPPIPQMAPIPRNVATEGEYIDPAAIDAKNRERRRQASKYGRQSTILAGNMAPGVGAPPTVPVKTALGA